MNTMSSALPKRSLASVLDEFADALTGPRRPLTVVLMLVGYCAIWTIYRLIATMPRDIHFDMSELYSWSLVPAFGYEKHPPLSAFVVHVWFFVFPVDDWSFTLLSIVNVVLTLYVVWLILERWTDPMKSAFGLMLLMVVPFYNFHALKYNANTVLLPVWAFAAYAFLRAYEERGILWSGLAGVAAGAAMLGKYWSIFLVAGFVLAALIDRRRKAFFLSAAPYVMTLAGAAVLAPHVNWVLSHSDTLAYAERRMEGRVFFSLGEAAKYISGMVAYLVLALALWAIILKPKAAAVRDVIRPDDPQRRLALWCFLLPNLLPMLVARWTGVPLTPLWTLPGYSLLPLVLLATPRIAVDRLAVKRLASVAMLFSFIAFAASPVVALALHLRTDPRPNDYGSLLAQDVAAAWKGLSDAPLSLIFSCGSSVDVAQAVAFDLRLPSRALFGKQGLAARADILAHGGAVVGSSEDAECKDQAEALIAMRPATTTLAKTYRPKLFGFAGKPFSYQAFIVPPP